MPGRLRRKFTDDEKRAIIDGAAQKGVNAILREHGLSYSVYSRWKEKFQPEVMKEQHAQFRLQQQVRVLTAENERLKKIIANQALEIQIKTEKLVEQASRFHP
ncbi:transposase [Flavihumibacter petaseus]|uniref:Transposase n=1 Tax=Flavihumibacter petaseus NBRC 106054 TaxID=1220578 RepID=A0A0E9MU49_9BACT|nr:transposase [Flavihumibacter petaseus]GAO41094.1 hypothetical protein FPE01S_01_01060 [Flavihumibacter petaseus NBRC 106054]